MLRKVVGESTAPGRMFSAVRDLLLAGSAGTVDVCRESFGRLGVSGRGVGMMDIMAFAEGVVVVTGIAAKP